MVTPRWAEWGAHGVMVAGMVAAIVAPGAMLPVAAGLLATAAALGPTARAAVGAREAIVDLWAMSLLAVSAVASAGHSAVASAGHSAVATGASAALRTSHHGGVPSSAFELLLSPVVVLTAWMLARAVLGATARRAAGIRHSLLTAAASAAQLLVMLALH
jgi:hypothetical protein